MDDEQVELNTKAPTCGAFAEPSNGLEPLTPSLPSRVSAKLWADVVVDAW